MVVRDHTIRSPENQALRKRWAINHHEGKYLENSNISRIRFLSENITTTWRPHMATKKKASKKKVAKKKTAKKKK